MKATRAILTGGLIAGALDVTYAIVFSAIRGATPMRLLQSVATGLLGKDAYDGGAPTAALGFILHFIMMLLIAMLFFAATRKLDFARRKPVVTGMLAGVVIYLVMNFVVLPLSQYPHPFRVDAFVITLNVLVHMFLIGVPISMAASKTLSQ